MELSREELKPLVHRANVTVMDRLLLLLLADGAKPKLPNAIKLIAREVGLRPKTTDKWNISLSLGRSKGLAISVPGGWEVTPAGLTHLRERTLIGDVHVSPSATKLRLVLTKITNERTREFVEEAVVCYEAEKYRASTVLSWVGAVAVLYEHVFALSLAAFNAELLRRNAKAKQVVALDDFTELKEDLFLDILQAISVIGKSVKDELKQRLQLRNGCGHPNNLAIGQHMAAAHLESLIANVYLKF